MVFVLGRVYICTILYVFKSRKVCSLGSEFSSFFPPLFVPQKAPVFRGPLPSLRSSSSVVSNVVNLTLGSLAFILKFYYVHKGLTTEVRPV
jgi:hypothetical protein